MPITDSLGNKFFDPFTQQLVALIAKELFGLAVDQHNSSLVVYRDYRVVSYFEKGSKIFPAFLQGLFRPLALRNFASILRKSKQFACPACLCGTEHVSLDSCTVLP